MLPGFWVIEDSTLLTKEVILTKKKGNLGSLCLKKKWNKRGMPEGYIAFSGEESNSIQPKMKKV